MPDEEDVADARAPVLYVTDLTFDRFDPADLFDLAFLLRSPSHRLAGVVFAGDAESGGRVVDALLARVERAGPVPYRRGAPGLAQALADAPEPLNVVAVGGYGAVAAALDADKGLFREKVARLFLVGGYVNAYAEAGRGTERVPLDPRLKERHPERFAPVGDPRIPSPEEQRAFGRLLTSGEGVIFLPRDICLWRYAAPQTLRDGGPLSEFLLRELFFANLPAATDRYAAASAPVLLSALPALLLAAQPDPFSWMRLFRAVTARAEADEDGRVASFQTKTDAPNLYAVVGVDGAALGRVLTQRLRDRPLVEG
jgi:hypothetical protein